MGIKPTNNPIKRKQVAKIPPHILYKLHLHNSFYPNPAFNNSYNITDYLRRDKMVGLIYLVTNLVNGKQYVGMTIRSLEERRREHEYHAKNNVSNSILHRAMCKYGFENFNWQTIVYTDEDNLNVLEMSYVDFYNTKAPNGYNLTDGGEGTNGYTFTDEQRKNLSKARRIFSFTKEDLIFLYLEQELTTTTIGAIHGCSNVTITKRLEEYNIPRRGDNTEVEIPKEELEFLYIDKKMYTTEIGEIYGCSRTTIRKKLSEIGIKSRNGVVISKEELLDLYINKGLSARQIAGNYGCSNWTILDRLRKYGIPIRPKGLQKGYKYYRQRNENT